MTSKPSNLVPLLALTAATATSILAFYYLNGQKKGSKHGDNSKPSVPTGQNNKTGSADAVKALSKGPSLESKVETSQTESKGEEPTPILTKVSTAEETSSGASTPEKANPAASDATPPQLEETTPGDATKHNGELDAQNTPSGATAVATQTAGSHGNEEKMTPEVPKVDAVPVSVEATKQATVDGDDTVISAGTESPADSTKELGQNAKQSTADQVTDEPKQDVIEKDDTSTQESPGAVDNILFQPDKTVNDENGEGEKSSDEQPLSTIDTTAEEQPSVVESVTTPSNATNEDKDTTNIAVTPAQSDKNGDTASTPTPAEMGTPEITKETEMNEEDLWQFLQREMKQNRRCEGCSAEEGGEKFKPCAKCRSALYCSRACQKKHWKQHKKVCCK